MTLKLNEKKPPSDGTTASDLEAGGDVLAALQSHASSMVDGKDKEFKEIGGVLDKDKAAEAAPEPITEPPEATVETIKPLSMAIPELEAVEQARSVDPMEMAPEEAVYISRHPRLTVHVTVPREIHKRRLADGSPDEISVGCEFKHGIFRTAQRFLIEALDAELERPGMRQKFQKTTNAQSAAMMQATHVRARENHKLTQSGVVSTHGQSDAATIGIDARLKDMQNMLAGV
jgi:hypothetical protein